MVQRIKTYLSDRVKDVKTTFKLNNTPAIVVTDENEMGTQMAKLLAAAGQNAPEVKYIFEINPEHTLIKQMADEADEETFNHWVEYLIGQAMLSEKGMMEDTSKFVSATQALLGKLA